MPQLVDLPLSAIVRRQIDRPSPIRQIMKMAERQNIVDLGLDPDDVISFGGGWVNHGAPEPYRRAYEEIARDEALFHRSGAYSATLGTDECREAIAALERHLFGVPDLTAANIAVGLGSTQLTHDLLRTLVDPGDTIVLVDPTYANYEGQLAFAVPGVRIARLPVLDPETWAYLPRTDPDRVIDTLEQIWRAERPKLVMFCAPDNPTSQIVPQPIVDAMMALAARDRAYVVVDFAYKCQYFVEPPPYFGWSPNQYPNLVAIHSNSKWARGLGRRLGWIEAAPPVIDGLERVQQCSILCPDMLQQMTMARYVTGAIADGSLRRYVDETNAAYRRAADATLAAVDAHLGLPRLEPDGGLYTVANVGRDGDGFVREALAATGVLVIPGRGFGETLTEGVRISYGPLVGDLAKIDEGLRRLGRWMQARA
jgi:aspartate/methionine/tyrosine aminotransferase